MNMAAWTAFPHLGDYPFDAPRVRAQWLRLHAGDAEPLPDSQAVLQAWALFHRGQFQQAAEAGLKAGGAGLAVANKATCVYANYLEKKEKQRLELFQQVAERAERQARDAPQDASAHYWQAYALGRYSQGISVAKALAQGLGGARVRVAFETAIRLRPQHADAHIGLGTFHAEMIDKVGALVAGMTYGASREQGLAMFREGLRLHPQSAIGLVEYANGLLMLAGDEAMDEATGLYERAAAITPLDAAQRLDVTLAQLELQDG
jgi:tetratricopeptide (TPR) repeat protein